MDLVMGDRVKYSVVWLRSTGSYTGPIPFARGEIVGMKWLSKATVLAVVDWDNDILKELPTTINVANLVHEKDQETRHR